MRRKTLNRYLLVTLAALLCAGSASAQLYKWKDAKGVTHFSDMPPASSRGRAEVTNYSGSGAASAPALPYELAQAVRANPVTFYTTPACTPCDQARSFLQQRGIPYSEKTVTTANDQQALKAAGSDGQLPMLLVGATRLLGFAPDAWKEALDAAYPSKPMLPRGYRFGAATPAAAPKPSSQELARAASARAALEAEDKAKFAPKPPPINGTPDFQF
jgi:glutaredoxin